MAAGTESMKEIENRGTQTGVKAHPELGRAELGRADLARSEANQSLAKYPESHHPEVVTPVQKKRNPLALGLAALAVIGVSVGTYAWWQHASSFVETDDAFITGRVHQLSSRVSGTVSELLVDDNQHVKQGEVLLRIDPKDLQISLATAQAAAAQAELKTFEVQSNIVANQRQAEARRFEAESAVASANAGVDKAKAMLSETKLGVTLAATAIKQRQAELTRCIADYERYKSL
ncbi:MAG TPA: biotin/lipoyl-binding protein, partial [Candidatus Melainabacteria bacterium]|nr:biotin/lipoyl-binding protein [Candidatus Melainabacteria bacterium]